MKEVNKRHEITFVEHTFYSTVVVAFVLLVHNGLESVFITALSFLPFLVIIFLKKRSLVPLAIYLVLFGAVGRYTRYLRENYASDALLAIRDFIGYLLAGKNIYEQSVMTHNGPAPFSYLPFSLFWYVPAQILHIDLRFFEMCVSIFMPIVFVGISFITRSKQLLPLAAVISLTPFLLDLSSDGSNDNSAIIFVLLSILFFVLSKRNNKTLYYVLSAIFLSVATSFKHYIFFYLLFFVPYLFKTSKIWNSNLRTYLLIFCFVSTVFVLPFIIVSPAGFIRSLIFNEIGNYHKIWGWNIWVVMRDLFSLTISRETMWLVRTVGTTFTVIISFYFLKLDKIKNVCLATGITMLSYLILSEWTTYAYFTFLLPLLSLSIMEE